MVAGADHGDRFKRDMGYNVAEFFRILPSAVSGYGHTVDGNRVVVRDAEGEREVVLVLRELPERRIGMIRIPRIEVEFAFNNFTVQQRQGFMLVFDRSFQRGGG